MDENINDIDLDFDFTPIGLAIKKARESKKITREQLVESLGISTRHLQYGFYILLGYLRYFDIS